MHNTANSDLIKKEAVIIIAVVAVVVGFLGGIVFSVFNSPGGTVQTSVPQGSPQNQQKISQNQAMQILKLEKEVASNPDKVEAWTQLGHVYFDTDQPAKAIRAYTRSLELVPDNPNNLTDLGVMYRRNGQPEKAVESFDKAIALDPNHTQSRFNKGVVLVYDLNDTSGAIKAWEDLVQINPSYKTSAGQTIIEALEDLKNNAN